MTERSLEELVRELREDFKIDDYLELRRRFPDKSTRASILSGEHGPLHIGFEYLLIFQDDCEKHGLDIANYIATLQGYPEADEVLCLRLLEAISKRQKLAAETPHAVANGHAIGDALVAFMISVIAECASHYMKPPPPSFSVLLQSYLGVITGGYKLDLLGARRVRMAIWAMAKKPDIGVRELARAIGVNPSTASRMIAGGLGEAVQEYIEAGLDPDKGILEIIMTEPPHSAEES